MFYIIHHKFGYNNMINYISCKPISVISLRYFTGSFSRYLPFLDNLGISTFSQKAQCNIPLVVKGGGHVFHFKFKADQNDREVVFSNFSGPNKYAPTQLITLKRIDSQYKNNQNTPHIVKNNKETHMSVGMKKSFSINNIDKNAFISAENHIANEDNRTAHYTIVQEIKKEFNVNNIEISDPLNLNKYSDHCKIYNKAAAFFERSFEIRATRMNSVNNLQDKLGKLCDFDTATPKRLSTLIEIQNDINNDPNISNTTKVAMNHVITEYYDELKNKG